MRYKGVQVHSTGGKNKQYVRQAYLYLDKVPSYGALQGVESRGQQNEVIKNTISIFPPRMIIRTTV